MLIIIYIFNIVLLLSVSATLYRLVKYKRLRTLKYVIFWLILALGVTLRMLGEISNWNDIIPLNSLSLVFNGFAYVFLINIFKAANNESNFFKTLYGGFFFDIIIWLSLTSIMKETGILPNYNIMLVVFNATLIYKTALISLAYDRGWFFVGCLLTGTYFLLTAYQLLFMANVLSSTWLFNIIAAIFMLVGTYKNGGTHG